MDLKDYIEEKCITKAKFARKIGINYTALHRILSKECYPSVSTAQRIVKLTNGEVTFEDLFKER